MRTELKTLAKLLALLSLVTLVSCGDADRADSASKSSYQRLFESEIENAARLAKAPETSIEGLSKLARLYHANGQLSEAIRYYEQLGELEPDNPRWPHALASILAGYGRLGEAMPLQLKAVRLAPDEPAPSLRFAEMYLKLNQVDEAETIYQNLLATKPEEVYALLGLARCDLSKDQLDSARQRLEQAVSIDANFIGGWALLSTVLEKLGQKELWEIARVKSFGRYVDFPDPWLNDLWMDCYDPYQLSVAAAVTTDKEQSKRLLEKALSLEPASSSYHRQLGNLLLGEGDAKNAKAEFEKAVEADSKDAEAWSSLVHILMEEKDFKTLSSTLEEALSLCPGSAYLHFINGRRYAMMGLYGQAKSELEEAKRIQPHEGRSYVHLAMIYLMEGKIGEARREAQTALKREPSNPEIYVILAKTSIMLGKQKDAKALIEKLSAIPTHSKADLEMLTQEYYQAFRGK